MWRESWETCGRPPPPPRPRPTMPFCCLVKAMTMEKPVSSAVIAGPPRTRRLCREFHQHTMIQCFVVDHRRCFHTSNGELLEDTRGERGGGRYHGTEALCTAGVVMTELFRSPDHVCALSSARVRQLRVTTAALANGGGEALGIKQAPFWSVSKHAEGRNPSLHPGCSAERREAVTEPLSVTCDAKI